MSGYRYQWALFADCLTTRLRRDPQLQSFRNQLGGLLGG